MAYYVDPDEVIRRILLPGGEPVGTPGRREEIRKVPGGLEAAEKMFDELAALGSKIEDPDYDGESAELPVIGKIGLRRTSRFGAQEPTIDVHATISGIKIDKIKFVE